MPTENRSSNNEMVSVPRELLERATKDYTGRPNWDALEPDRIKAVEELAAILARPAEQHQDEPVALPARESLSGRLPGHEAIGWNAYADEVAKLGPLYSRPVQGEPVVLVNSPRCGASWPQFESVCGRTKSGNSTWQCGECARKEAAALRAEMDKYFGLYKEADTHAVHWQQQERTKARWAKKVESERDTLRAQLDERDALLRDINKRYWSGVDFDLPADLAARVKALSASAPVERLHKEHIKALEACSELSAKQRDHWMAECKKRDARLDERDALLEDWHTANATGEVKVSDKAYRIVTRTAAALSASAEPSAPVDLCSTCKGYGKYQDGDSGNDEDGRSPNIVECECDDSERMPEYLASAPKCKGWTCFHCGEHFTDSEAAATHFGTHEIQRPACLIDAAEYRSMEERVRECANEDSELHRQLRHQASNHKLELQRAEESGYAKGLADASAPVERDERNAGHGHVFPRPDGVRAKCGGPGLCKECTADQAMILTRETERSCFEQEFPVPEWAEWSDTVQSYVKREDFICSATALAMYRKAYQAWMARAALERKP